MVWPMWSFLKLAALQKDMRQYKNALYLKKKKTKKE